MRKLHNMRAIITGGSSGIGQSIAIALAEQGCNVVFSYCRNKRGAQETLTKMESIGKPGLAIKTELSKTSDLQQLIDQGCKQLGGLDIFINNAGTLSRHKDFLDIPLDQLEQVQKINFNAPFLLTQLAAKQIQKHNNGGSIINISSISATISSPGLTHYECSKAALNALTRGAAISLAPHNIRVNAISPGLVETPLNQAQRSNDTQTWLARQQKIPLKRAGKPHDIAQMTVMLASPQSKWITGSIICIDGGSGIQQ